MGLTRWAACPHAAPRSPPRSPVGCYQVYPCNALCNPCRTPSTPSRERPLWPPEKEQHCYFLGGGELIYFFSKDSIKISLSCYFSLHQPPLGQTIKTFKMHCTITLQQVFIFYILAQHDRSNCFSEDGCLWEFVQYSRVVAYIDCVACLNFCYLMVQ